MDTLEITDLADSDSFPDSTTSNQVEEVSSDMPFLFITKDSIILSFSEQNYLKLNEILFHESKNRIEFEDNILEHFGKKSFNLDTYGPNNQLSFQKRLFQELNLDAEICTKKSLQFKNAKGFVLTASNYQQILFIHHQMAVGGPLVLTGGFGKTYLLEFYAEVLRNGQISLKIFVLHPEISMPEIAEFVESMILVASELKEQSQELWILFDAIEMGSLHKFISDLMIDRVFCFGPQKCISFVLNLSTLSIINYQVEGSRVISNFWQRAGHLVRARNGIPKIIRVYILRVIMKMKKKKSISNCSH